MELKTSNKLLLGYIAGLFVLIGATIILGFTSAENLQMNGKTADVEYQSEELGEFSVLHISGKSTLNLDKGDAFEIIRSYYPNGSGETKIDYYIQNDTCFVTRWERTGMNHAVMKVGNIDAVIVENKNHLFINDFNQDSLMVSLHTGKLETNHKLFRVGQLELTAHEGSYAMLQGVSHLHLVAEDSKVQVFGYLESVSGEIQNASRLELHKSVGKLDLVKSRDSKLISY
jgi:hypothetical protein